VKIIQLNVTFVFHTCFKIIYRWLSKICVVNLLDENHETGLIQAKGPSGEGRRPKWRRTKPPSGEG